MIIIPPYKRSLQINIFFLFLHKNICCGYSLEAPSQGISNEYPQHKNEYPQHKLFCGEKRKISSLFEKKISLIWSYGYESHSAKKHHTVLSWIPPPVGFKPKICDSNLEALTVWPCRHFFYEINRVVIENCLKLWLLLYWGSSVGYDSWKWLWYHFQIHHNLFITLLLGSIAKTVLVKQPCYIQTKMYRLYWKMTIYGHFSI